MSAAPSHPEGEPKKTSEDSTKSVSPSRSSESVSDPSKGSAEAEAAETSDKAKETPATGKSAGAKPRRSWRKRLVRFAIALGTLFVVLRIVLVFALPGIIERAFESYDLSAGYDRLRLSLLSGDLEIWHFALSDEDRVLVDAEYIRADVSILNLLRGRLVIPIAEADGVDLVVGRDEQGRLLWLERFMTQGDEPAEEDPVPVPDPSDDSDSAIALTSPLKVDALRLQHLQVTVRDDSVSPPLSKRIDCNVRLSSLGHPERPARLEVDLGSAGLLDDLTLEIRGRAEPTRVSAELKIRMEGLRLEPLRGYLIEAGLEPVAEIWSGRMQAELELTKESVDAKTIKAQLIVSESSFSAGKQETLGLDRLQIDASYTELGPVLHRAELVGARCQLTVGESVRVAGLRPVAASDEGKGASVQFVIESLTATPAIPELGAEAKGELEVKGVFAAPGLVEQVRLDGTLQPRGPERTALLELHAHGIDPKVVASQLAAKGIESQLEDASFVCRASTRLRTESDGVIKASAALEALQLTSGREVLGLDALRFTDLELDLARSRIGIGAIEVDGPRVRVGRDQEGALLALGLRFGAPPVSPSSGGAESPRPIAEPQKRPISTPGVVEPTVAKKTTPSPLRIELDRLSWTNTRLIFEDWAQARPANTEPKADGESAVEPKPVTIEVADLGVEITNLALGGEASAASRSGSFRAWLEAPGCVEQLEGKGTVQSGPDGFRVEFETHGAPISGEAWSPYLAGLGVEEDFEAAEIRCGVVVHAEPSEAGWNLGARVERLSLSDRGEELFGWELLEVDPIRLGDGEVRVERLHWKQPRLRVRTLETGQLGVLGLVTVRGDAAAQQPMAPTSPAPPPQENPKAPSSEEAGPGSRFVLESLEFEDMRLTWSHAGATAPLEARLRVALADLVIGDEASPPAPADLTVEASIADVLESFKITGGVVPSPGQADLVVSMNGLNGERLQSWLPSGLELEMRDGRLDAQLAARVQPHATGGSSLRLSLEGVDYRDGREDPYLLLPRIEAKVTRLDSEKGVYEIAEVGLDGLELDVEQDAEVGLRLLGLRLAPAEPTQPIASNPANSEGSAEPQAPPTTPTAAPGRTSTAPNPRVFLEKLDLNVARIAYRDTAVPESLELRDLRIWNPEPWVVLDGDEDLESLPPLALEWKGKVDPVLEGFHGSITTAPFVADSWLKLTFDAKGVKGAALASAVPGLPPEMRAESLESGHFHTELQVTLEQRRRKPTDFDFSRPFAVGVDIGETYFRDGEGPVLAGVDEVVVTGARIDPRSGDVRIQSVQVQTPRGKLSMTENGLEVLGLELGSKSDPSDEGTMEAEAGTEAAVTPTVAQVDSAESKATATKSKGSAPPSGPLFAIDRIEVFGLDFLFEDLTGDYPMVLPLTDLEFAARGFAQGAKKPKPFRFTVRMNSGKTPVPGHEDRGEQPVFGEVAVTGSLQLEPQLTGSIKAGLEALELATFRGPAASSGVVIVDGLFDTQMNLNFRPDGSFATDSRFVFTDLDLSEQPGGPIERFLKLPTPLDAVLFVLRDAAGAIKIPLAFDVGEGGVSGGQIARVATKTLAVLITNAIAASPFRVVGGAGSLIGLGGDSKEKQAEEPLVMDYASGAVLSSAELSSQLTNLVARLKNEPSLMIRIEHEVGRGDQAVAQYRTNPPREDCIELTQRLQSRKSTLVAARSAAFSKARESTVSNLPSDAAKARNELRRLERELGLLERSLDRMLELSRPRAEHRERRRTRDGCVALARARLIEVHQLLLERGLDPDRIRVKAARYKEPEREGGGCIRIYVLPVRPS